LHQIENVSSLFISIQGQFFSLTQKMMLQSESKDIALFFQAVKLQEKKTILQKAKKV